MRLDARMPDKARKVKITAGYLKYAEGSALIEMGNTKVICSVSIEERVPPFLKGTGEGWVTAEYGMLPRSTGQRNFREASLGKIGARTHEIQRMIGRSLRAVTNLKCWGERTLLIDCDVIQADGGTRTASITGGFIALVQAINRLKKAGLLLKWPIYDYLAAISVGIVEGKMLLDLCYEEDFRAEVDMNLVMTASGEIVEIQATAEEKPFTEKQLEQLIALGKKGIEELIVSQKEALGEIELAAR